MSWQAGSDGVDVAPFVVDSVRRSAHLCLGERRGWKELGSDKSQMLLKKQKAEDVYQSDAAALMLLDLTFAWRRGPRASAKTLTLLEGKAT